MFDAKRLVPIAPLYRKEFEHDNCGIGACVNIKGKKEHATVEHALKIVENLEHRAGKDAEGKTGDGVGILTQVPHKFMEKCTTALGINLGGEREYGVGMFFFPQEEMHRNQAMKMFEIIVEKEGLEFLGWRKVETIASVLGHKALECMPFIMQGFVKKPVNIEKGLPFDRRLYMVRRVFEQSGDNTYVVSLSSRTIVYKGMFLVGQLRTFFADLQDKDYESAIAIVHSRFSTNTSPSWERAHPNRFIVHNGEINTIRGNADKMLAREENMESEHLHGQLHKVLPVVNASGSDSSILDNTLEFLIMSGMELPLAVMITIPEPWANNKTMNQHKKDFYQYYATMMEPWDGPASILFSDGDMMGAVLDRNGLRPSRYMITSDDQLILSSEVGVLDIPPEKIVVKERLRPGKMLLVDTVKGEVIDDEKLKEKYACSQPYGEWLDSHLVSLKDLKIPNQRVTEFTHEERQRMQKAFGYAYEELKYSILPMARDGAEAIVAMGVDTPIPVLSKTPHPLFHYFKQLFAQVTNPPIDAIREEVVTSTTVYIGTEGNVLEENPKNCNVLRINNPILTNTDILKIKSMKADGFKVEVVPITYYKNTRLERAIERLFVEVDRAYREGANMIILSDRGVDENHVAIPSLLAVSALNRHLVKTKKRTSMALILESGEPREVHHFATLLGYGACAVNPYLAQESIKELIENRMLDKDYYAAVDDYNYAILHGIVKIASKMGISTIQSYQGAQIFEAIGIDYEVVKTYFTNTVCRVGGITLKDIENQVDQLHVSAFDPLRLETDLTLNSLGHHKMRSGADEHLYNPAVIHLLQESTKRGDYHMFKQYTGLVNDENSIKNLRGLMDFNYPHKSIPLEEVESVDSIVTRFKTGAMSYGSISKEAHETMAIAMNQLQGKSNSGEGGEDLERLHVEADGRNRCSAIKQVASGRFGVTSRYLVSAKEIQIKMSQGAKPGEGGHLPGEKVYPWIAKTRHSTPGVGLISPPPHHDIYSIEDLAELIYDLKNANKDARISVKLVSEAGVGTIAAGVAKAGAQVILVSGYDGGTGAAPRNSIHNAGLPWELGLAETHQTLIMNGLRSKVRIETDGKLMSGRDVAIAAILGAEEFGFATAPLVTMGCIMMRVCNLDTCPVGVATQNPELRKNFKGKPEYVINFMRFIAEELREYMAKLGVRTLDELVGRTDLLKVKDNLDKNQKQVDLKLILANPYEGIKEKVTFDPKQVYHFHLEKTLDEKVLLKQLSSAIDKGTARSIEVHVKNTDRALGTILGSEITKKLGDHVAEDTYHVLCNGAGGQSFGAFIPKGLTLELVGESNDYFGKGLSGGKLTVYPPRGSRFKTEDNIIIGNVALYGATSGKAFINGVAGERFCVRNSGAYAVVEGVGDHGCEYMTGGRVVVLGLTGKNFAAGMSGGIAYVLDENNDLYMRLNKEMVSSHEITSKYDVLELEELIKEHVALTNSEKGKRVLNHFNYYLPKFKKITPHDYERMQKSIVQMEEKGLSAEQVQIETSKTLNPKERIKNFNEFHNYLPMEKQQLQGARCMECGVPFCQSGMTINGMTSGCPLHNLIPEWNNLVYSGNWQQAYERLKKTNNFPEFTSRVCPALCEEACTCGLHGDPVATKENEYAIAEYAYENGYDKAQPPKNRTGKKVAVIGSGPTGLTVADQLNRRGHQVTVYERSDRIGGLLMYGIPNMKLDKNIVERKVRIMAEEGTQFITGVDVGRDIKAEELLKTYDRVVLACGSSNPRDVNVPGRDAQGIYFAVDFLKANTKSLLDSDLEDDTYITTKGKNVLIIGGGDTGNDCAGTAIRHGCKSVTQIEMMPKAPDTRAENNPWPQWPKVCKTDYGQEEAITVFGHDPRIYESTVKEFIKDKNGKLKNVKIIKLFWEKDEHTGQIGSKEVPDSEQVLPAEIVLIAAGFLGSQKYVTDAFKVEIDERTNVKTTINTYNTNIRNVFAAGDMRRGQSLVVWAIREGREAAKAIDESLMGYSNLVVQ